MSVKQGRTTRASTLALTALAGRENPGPCQRGARHQDCRLLYILSEMVREVVFRTTGPQFARWQHCYGLLKASGVTRLNRRVVSSLQDPSERLASKVN